MSAAATGRRPPTASVPDRFLPLTPAAFHILLSLADGDKHGYGVIVDVRERTEGRIRLGTGTLYTALKRFLDQGLVLEHSVADPEDARRQSSYSITALGVDVVSAEASRLEGMVDLARQVLATGPRGPAA